MDQKKTPLYDAIKNFADQAPTNFYIPGHKSGQGIDPKWREYVSDNIFKMDLSEVFGLDDFHCPKGVIKEAQELAADAWGAKRSHFLVNGTSGGIVAAICTSVSEGEKIAIPRNAHKSVTSAMIISGATPEYLLPEYDPRLGLVCGMKPETLEKAFAKAPDIKAVFSVSPSYHGICSDIKSLAKIAHDNGCALIADEAHGNHMYFSDKLPEGALVQGADISCQSTHKMSGSLTQSSMLHVNSDRVNLDTLGVNLNIVQTTSPSYILMASLDVARSYIATEGKRIFDELFDVCKDAREEISSIQGIEVLGDSLVGYKGISAYEPMRFVVSSNTLGIDGYGLRTLLREKYSIEAEYSDLSFAICVLGIGTTKEDVNRLVFALKDISKEYANNADASIIEIDDKFILPEIPKMHLTPREAWKSEKEKISWQNAVGKISAEMIVPYPPGIPIICPGEMITKDVWDYLENQRINGWHFHTADEGKLEFVNVIK